MLLLKPENVVFENKTDLIRYVGRGLPPTKKNFDRLMTGVGIAYYNAENPNSQFESSDVPKIDPKVVMGMSRSDLDAVLKEVYKNNLICRNVCIGVVAGVAVVALISAIGKAKRNSEDDF